MRETIKKVRTKGWIGGEREKSSILKIWNRQECGVAFNGTNTISASKHFETKKNVQME